MAAINVTEEAHAEAKARAAELGISLSQYASERLTAQAEVVTIENVYPWVEPFLMRIAQERSETPEETLEAALAALVAPTPIFDAGPWRAAVEACVEAAGCEPCDPQDAAMVIGRKFMEAFPKEGFQTVGVGMIQIPKPVVGASCRCDGPDEDGPWHKHGCGRKTG
tara:strand:- start:2399 stop:2896 length:498 start_codon:yes stop_codon:yes gene_type:complete